MSLDKTQMDSGDPDDAGASTAELLAKRGSSSAIDLKAIRAKLQQPGAPQVWRSLDEVAGTAEFQDYLHREFPSNASEWTDPVGRRNFLKLMSASMALAGVTACTVQPDELIVPYVRQPEEEIPGKPLFYATAMTLGGVASGLLVESHEGRPTKIEGNPDHPASKGATDLFAQGSILTLYDPDRSQTLTQLGDIRPWSSLIGAMRGGLSAQAASKGAGLRILTETVASPTLAAQIQQVLAQHPGAKWIQWEPVNRDNARAGARTAFGQYVEPIYDLTKADVILSLESDFLSSDGAHNLYYMRQFASRRRVEESADNLSRLYVVEADHSLTGGRADNRLPMKSSQIEAFARAVAAGSGRQRCQRHRAGGLGCICRGRREGFVGAPGPRRRHGRRFPAGRGARARARHQRRDRRAGFLSADAGNRRDGTDRRARRAGVRHQRRPRADAGDHRRIEPGYSAPADFKFAEAMRKVSLVVHSGLFFDETATLSHWHIPATHYLEAWSDARTIDGTVSIVQPLIQPLYGGKSAHEVIATMSERPERNGYDIVREYWQAQRAARCHGCAGALRRRWPPARRCTAPPHPRNAGTGALLRLQPQRACQPHDAASSGLAEWLHDGLIDGSAPVAGADVATVAAGAGDASLPSRRGPRKAPSKWCSSATRRCTTAASPTTAGCRNCPSRSPS